MGVSTTIGRRLMYLVLRRVYKTEQPNTLMCWAVLC